MERDCKLRFDWRESLKQAIGPRQWFNHIGHAGLVALILLPFAWGMDFPRWLQGLFIVAWFFAEKELFEAYHNGWKERVIKIVDSLLDKLIAVAVAGVLCAWVFDWFWLLVVAMVGIGVYLAYITHLGIQNDVE